MKRHAYDLPQQDLFSVCQTKDGRESASNLAYFEGPFTPANKTGL